MQANLGDLSSPPTFKGDFYIENFGESQIAAFIDTLPDEKIG